MQKDRLFLLAPGFLDKGERQYCPECAEAFGLLSYFPAIKESLEIVYQPLNRPRQLMVSVLGEANQNCPTLVLDEYSPEYEACGIKQFNSIRFIDNARDIGRYCAQRFGTPYPR